MYRGSRKHVLDWLAHPAFASELLSMIAPIPVEIVSRSAWAPRGYAFPGEARLERWGPKNFGHYAAWSELQSWWLEETRGANTPNWDLALTAEIEGKLGLVLAEAKANVPELSAAWKGPPRDSDASRANHERIAEAIIEASC